MGHCKTTVEEIVDKIRRKKEQGKISNYQTGKRRSLMSKRTYVYRSKLVDIFLSNIDVRKRVSIRKFF